MINIIKHFVIYGILGLLLETFWTGIHSAVKGDKNLKCQTYLWMFFIYGSAVVFEPVHNVIRPVTFVLRGLIWAVLIFGIEYLSGFILKKSIGNCPWDYSEDSVLTIDGIIRFDYLPVWFCVGMIFEKIHDFLIYTGI